MTNERQNADEVRVSRVDLLAFIEAVDAVAHYSNRQWRIRQRLLKAAQTDGEVSP